MTNLLRVLTLGCCALIAFSPASARSKHRHSSGRAQQFSSYLFVLSWSPEYCQSHQSSAQCSSGKHFGFVVHGLWPEYNGGGSGPENCSNAPGLSNPSQMLDIMPDLGLIAHEWKTHGTCSGLSADTYFAQIRTLYQSVKIPSNLQNPQKSFTESPGQVSQQLSQANLNIPVSSIQVTCPGNYLNDVRICLDKSFHAQTCTAPPACRANTITIPPVQ